MKKMVLLATLVAVVALIMAAAPAMASEWDGHNHAFNNGGVIIQNGNVGFNTGFNTGLGLNGCGNFGCNGLGFDGCNFGCNTGFVTPIVGFNTCDWWCINGGFNTWNTWDGNNCWCGNNNWNWNHDRDDNWRWNKDRDDNWRWNKDRDDNWR